MYFVWNRSEDDEAYPRVWLDFEAKDIDSNKIVKYRIQDLQEYRFGDAIIFLTEHYLSQDSVLKAKGIMDDEVSKQEIADFWTLVLSQKMSLVCYKENSKEILAVNLLCVLTKPEYYEKKTEFNGKSSKECFELYDYIRNQVNILEKHNVDKYLTSHGMAVLPEYRGRGIATELLKARLPLCRAFDIKLTSTTFTSIHSQIPAYKVGFQADYESTYVDLTKQGFTFPGIRSKIIKTMSLLID